MLPKVLSYILTTSVLVTVKSMEVVKWICNQNSPEVTRTDVDCARLQLLDQGCYFDAQWDQYEACGPFCNDVHVGTVKERGCRYKCDGYLNDYCVTSDSITTAPPPSKLPLHIGVSVGVVALVIIIVVVFIVCARTKRIWCFNNVKECPDITHPSEDCPELNPLQDNSDTNHISEIPLNPNSRNLQRNNQADVSDVELGNLRNNVS